MYRSIDDALIYRSTAVAIYHRFTDLAIHRSIDVQIYYSDQQFPPSSDNHRTNDQSICRTTSPLIY